ncbi:MAG TPA: D-galactarate dehydratase [Clostridiales bacterium]|nr:D-galactarate dehydratase [Clostridiales bacterium]
MNLNIALKVNDRDNVATIFAEVKAGTKVEVRDKKGNSETITVAGDIPYGNKIALFNIHIGKQIYKYGEEIGVATQEIKKGDYVHVHNLDSIRGRGDL